MQTYITRAQTLGIGHTSGRLSLSLHAANGAFRIDGMTAKMGIAMLLVLSFLISASLGYDPKDEMLKDILLPAGQFEAFYQKGPRSEEENAARPPHLHGSFNKYRNPALVGAPNSAAYGFRFDGKRRFNYD